MFWLVLIAACIAFPPFGEALLCLVLLYFACVLLLGCIMGTGTVVIELWEGIASMVAKVPSLFRRWLAWMNAR